MLAALYGVYNCESLPLLFNLDHPICILVSEIKKRNEAVIPLGYFDSSDYSEISAIFYNPLATWGKIRALASNGNKLLEFVTTHHPGGGGEQLTLNISKNENYSEFLLDGLYIFHNPYAKYPLPLELFKNKYTTQYYKEDGEFKVDMPKNFLITRQINYTRIKEYSQRTIN